MATNSSNMYENLGQMYIIKNNNDRDFKYTTSILHF